MIDQLSHCPGGRHAEQVERAPDRLLGGEVRVPCEREQAGRAEPARHVARRAARRQRAAGASPVWNSYCCWSAAVSSRRKPMKRPAAPGIEQVERPRRAGRRDGWQRDEQQQQDLVERHEAEVEEPPAPGTREQRIGAEHGPAIVLDTAPGGPCVATATPEVEGEARAPGGREHRHEHEARLPARRGGEVPGEDRWHDAPELVDLAVVPGDLAGDEGQQRDGNRDQGAAVQEVQLQRVE